ncbi:hypothetical protein PoB_000155700 [Plakobranchus ocellatus]|uniref:Uncharacterized protein n=1 Tax=Plakobranchus ocellatus TaxID=259542 RepID=A0AAV3XYX9_9GAST|nr:hypothetical protein PoB_000155700 [Plakobranchus ocellatus]
MNPIQEILTSSLSARDPTTLVDPVLVQEILPSLWIQSWSKRPKHPCGSNPRDPNNLMEQSWCKRTYHPCGSNLSAKDPTTFVDPVLAQEILKTL